MPEIKCFFLIVFFPIGPFGLCVGFLNAAQLRQPRGLRHTTPEWPDSCLSFISSESLYSIFRDRGEMKKSLRTGQGYSLTIYRITLC